MIESGSLWSGRRQRQAGAVRGWPGYLFVLLVLGATIYAFSPRHLPPFPPTQLQPDQLLVTGLARQGSRLIAAGELGHILYANDRKGPWHEALIKPQQGSTFTQVKFIGKDLALAVGHGGWIVRSEDGGKTWKGVAFDPKQAQPLLGVAGPFDGKLFAYGAFGLLMTSTDLGKTWQTQKFNITSAADAAKGGTAKPVDPNADPFANFTTSDNDLAGHHLYGMTRLDDGALLLVGERGLMARSTDGGQNWTELPQIYDGSFFGVLKPTPHSVLAFGMRGHAFLSTDAGKTWKASVIPQVISLFGGTVMADGRVVLVGEQDSVMVSDDGGAHFTLASQGDRGAMDAVLGFGQRDLLTAGIQGVHSLQLPATSAAKGGVQP